ncbi:hypothetical protein ABZS44_28075 [Micromonospora sediminicola]|uniref:hypothetical protein n=1 Tax=Micromonospora sediminicola TaxID=946078 RepID=UPI00339F6324
MSTHRNSSRRLRFRLAAAIIAALTFSTGTVAATSTAASAATQSANWQSFTLTSKWTCNYRTLNQRAGTVTVAVCIIVNGNLTQPALIIKNYSGNSIKFDAINYLITSGDRVDTTYCNNTLLSNGYETACFGPTRSFSCGRAVQGLGTFYLSDPYSPDWPDLFYQDTYYSQTRQMCTT